MSDYVAEMPGEHPALVEVRRLLDRLKIVELSANNATEVERRDCLKALKALAEAHISTPAEGYGSNTSWAIDDLCKGIKILCARLQNAENRPAPVPAPVPPKPAKYYPQRDDIKPTPEPKVKLR